MKLVLAASLLVAGLGTGLATLAVHQSWWGLLLGLTATVVTLLGLGPGWSTRLPFAAGWSATVLWASPTRPEGDYVLSSDLSGYAVLATALAVVVWSVATLPRPARRPS